MVDARPVDVPREPEWRTWMRELGDRARRMREFLGLSQEQLARLARVSQGAVSRFEMGRGLGTPLLVALKIHAAIAARLGQVDARLLTDAARDLLTVPEFEHVIRMCSRIPDDRRRVFVAVMTALADALCKPLPA
jgi:transcriptional regulator with XRE-family HTH domain